MEFTTAFREIPPAELTANAYTALGAHTGKDYFAITAGEAAHYNSMIGSGGGLGLFMKKPTMWCLLRADRYTLELMEQRQTYTLSYFAKEYQEQAFFLAGKTGRGTGKMAESQLTALQTPAGNMAFAEARLIVECRLLALTTITPNELRARHAKDYVREEYKQESHYRKIAFGEITHAWMRNSYIFLGANQNTRLQSRVFCRLSAVFDVPQAHGQVALLLVAGNAVAAFAVVLASAVGAFTAVPVVAACLLFHTHPP